MKFSTVVIDSRSDKHPDWVYTCLESIKNQTLQTELIVINNIGRKKTIGECWNEGVKKAKGEWILFVGDDDYIARDYIQVLNNYTNIALKKYVHITTYMTPFSNEKGTYANMARQCTGAWRRDYLLENPFNEKLERGVDRQYLEETVKKGFLYLIIHYYYGYFYRKHNDYSCAGKINFEYKPKDYLFFTGNRIFLEPLLETIPEEKYMVLTHFNSKLADKAKVIWAEWGEKQAIEIADYKCSAKKILRIHAYEAYYDTILYIDFKKYDTVIFVAEHIKRIVEKNCGKIPNAVIIPNGIDTDKFTIAKDKEVNNKIAYAGYITRKKGIGELLLLAKSLPEYEFHIAGKYQENDVAQYLNEKKPVNVFVHPWQDDLNEWFKDKSYIINTSLRESQGVSTMQGMASGLKPLIYNWIGAEEIYKSYTFDNIDQIKTLLADGVNPMEYREIILKNYQLSEINSKLLSLIEGDK